jgi:hypothetical protein
MTMNRITPTRRKILMVQKTIIIIAPFLSYFKKYGVLTPL